jgi:hypothetical protein
MNRKIILRVYLFLKHPYKLKIKNSTDSEDKLIYPPNYSHNHVAVFENELESPHHSYLIKNNFERWLLRNKLNHKNWKLVDVDNFMKGNSFFLNKSPIEQIIGNVYSNKNFVTKLLSEKFPEITNPESNILKSSVKDEKKASVKKERKKKDEEEKNSVKDENKQKSEAIEFNYKVIKYKMPVNDSDYLLHREETLKIFDEYEKLVQKESLKKSESIINKYNDQINSLEVDFISLNYLGRVE